jgi:hypothetical protein
MSKFHDFLVEHAMFPFPRTDELQNADTTDISDLEVGLLERGWKAKRAVRDEALAQKLCSNLKNILGDSRISASAERALLAKFSPQVQYDEYCGENRAWLKNPNESKVSLQKISLNPG